MVSLAANRAMGDMQSDLPWNISGISTEAREAARAAARREGLSLGEWLTRRITQGGGESPDSNPEIQETLNQLLAQTDRAGQNTAVLQAMVEAMRTQLEEQKAAGASVPDQEGLAVLSQQIETQIRMQQEFAEQTNAKIAVLANTMAKMGGDHGASPLPQESGALRQQLDRAISQTDGRITALCDSFVSLSGSMDLLRRDFREAMNELGSHLGDFDDRLQQLEERFGVLPPDEEQIVPPPETEARVEPQPPAGPEATEKSAAFRPEDLPRRSPSHSFNLAADAEPKLADPFDEPDDPAPSEDPVSPDARLDAPWRNEDYDDEEDEAEDHRRRGILILLRCALFVAVLLAAAAAFMAYKHIGIQDLQAMLMQHSTQVQKTADARPAAPHHSAADIQALTRLAQNGNSQAMMLLGLYYADGTGVPPDAQTAVNWLSQASSAGEAIAQYRLGILYEGGHGLDAAPDKAAIQFSLAAKAGNLQAMYLLASAYATGSGVDQNAAEAAHWYQKAAGFGLADAAYNLAGQYAQGDGVDASLPTAYKWYAIAAAAGDSDAAPHMVALTAKLSPSELADAQKAARDFRPASAPAESNVVPDADTVLSAAKK